MVESAGIRENVHPHRLRHTYATELLRGGLNLVGVMKLLGHKTIKMTLHYVEVTNKDLGRDYRAPWSPRAMESARQRYSTLRAIESSHTPVQDQSSGTIADAFKVLVDRIQARRFEDSDPKRRKKLQRLVENRNEYLLHSQVHEWFATGKNPMSLEDLNERVYAELFLMPRSDPWLGLVPADAYTALPREATVDVR